MSTDVTSVRSPWRGAADEAETARWTAVAGEVADSLIFYPIAFYGVWSNEQLISVMIGNYFIKVLWEVFATPLTYLIVGFLKRAEHEDFYDKETDFNPFSLET